MVSRTAAPDDGTDDQPRISRSPVRAQVGDPMTVRASPVSARAPVGAAGWIATVRRSGARVARRSRVASVVMVLVLLGVSVFAVAGSQLSAAAAERAVSASAVSDDYWRAATAVGAEESLERKYRLEPGAGVRARFDGAAAALGAALVEVARDGDGGDRDLVDRVSAQHRTFLAAAARQFAAIDRADPAEALRIDAEETDPAFSSMEAAVLDAAGASHDRAVAALRDLQDLEALTRVLTPAVFVAGLLLAGVLASMTRGYRRLLAVERERAVHDAQHDALTGLPSRVLLVERIERAVAGCASTGPGVGLLLLGLDRFRDINDAFGYLCGDRLITGVGARLRAALPDTATVTRLGGDEFAVLLPRPRSVERVVETAARLRCALSAPFPVDGVELDVEAGVGVAVSGPGARDADALLRHADIAMHVAKQQGRGVVVYDRGLDRRHSPAKLALLGDLRRALDRHELLLHYQPKLGLGTGEVVGVEALLRWHHPRHGVLAPGEFMPFAEHTGLIGPLTRAVLDMALAQAGAWCEQGCARTVAVNLSARNLLDEQLPGTVADLLAVHGVAAELLVFEVTESAVMTEPQRARQLLEELSAQGIGIAIDDFGAGYTSLGQLKSLPVGELKIDRSFVTTMTEDGRNALIVQSVIDLGHNLGLSIVAEGVEDERTLGALAALGCDVAQGFHIGRPMTVEALDAWPAPGPSRSAAGCSRRRPG
jgi:diguanylate cyclase (GGDEF)-like protein